MYLRDKIIKVLKIKNILLNIFGIFNVVTSAFILLSLFITYHDDIETFKNAKATPECIESIKIGVIVLIISIISKLFIGDANFYSAYFEADLDGSVKYDELAEVMSRNKYIVMLQLFFFKFIYMKGYTVSLTGKNEYVTLNSKKYLCECKHCGANIEKSVYFTGTCEYCGSSDLNARVITDNRFYTIKSNMSSGIKNPSFYITKNYGLKMALTAIGLVIAFSVISISIIAIIDQISKYNNHDYLREALFSGKGRGSYKLIKKDLLDTTIAFSAFFIGFLPLAVISVIRFRLLIAADKCSVTFSASTSPFVGINQLPISKGHKRTIRIMRKTLRRRFLCNCTFEKHNNTIQIALAKKVVKDECPSCAAPIAGSVDENYKCSYCGNVIMGVLIKK